MSLELIVPKEWKVISPMTLHKELAHIMAIWQATYGSTQGLKGQFNGVTAEFNMVDYHVWFKKIDDHNSKPNPFQYFVFEMDFCESKNLSRSVINEEEISSVVDVKIAMGGDVIAITDTYDEFGRKFIHTVAIQDQENAVNKLEALGLNGEDLKVRELRTGNTLLHIAVKTHNYPLAEWLCRRSSIQKEAVNYNYETAYRIAFKARDLKMMQLLRFNDAAYVNSIAGGLSDDSS